jgi:hypothetical protein
MGAPMGTLIMASGDKSAVRLKYRLTAVSEDTHIDYEVIFVDDDRNDDCLNQLVPTSTFQVGRSCPLPKNGEYKKIT